MALGTYKTTLTSQIKGDIESKIRTYILGGDMTSYPNLTNFSQALAESIANRVVDAITSQSSISVSVTVPALSVSPGTFVAGSVSVIGAGTTTSTPITGTGSIS